MTFPSSDCMKKADDWQAEALKYKEALQQIEMFTLDLIGEDATVKPFVLQVAQRALGKSSGVFKE